MNLVLRKTFSRHTFKIYEGIRWKPLPLKLPLITSQSPFPIRYYSNEKSENKILPPLMDFPPIIWPSFIKFIKNWLFANFIIRPYFENDFNLPDFVEASKHAVQVFYFYLNVFKKYFCNKINRLFQKPCKGVTSSPLKV